MDKMILDWQNQPSITPTRQTKCPQLNNPLKIKQKQPILAPPLVMPQNQRAIPDEKCKNLGNNRGKSYTYWATGRHI